MEPNPRLAPFQDFPSAVESAMDLLRARYGLTCWTLGRKVGADWIALRVAGNTFKIAEGDVLPWEDTPCALAAEKGGVLVMADRTSDPALAEIPLVRRLKIGSFIAAPIQRADGSLFGAISGIDPDPLQNAGAVDVVLFEMIVRFLSTSLAADLQAMEDALRIEQMRVESLADPITGLGNRRYWTHLLAAEESRCRRYGDPAVVIVMDLHDGRAELLREAGDALRSTSRTHDVVARVGGASLALLAVNCHPEGAKTVTQRIRKELRSRGVVATVGAAVRKQATGLEGAWMEADSRSRSSNGAGAS